MMMQSTTTMAASVPSSSSNFMANGESERGPPGQRPLSPVVSPPLPVPDVDSEREDTSREVIEDAIPVRSTSPESPEARDQVSHMHNELLGSPLHGFNSPHEPKDRTSDTHYAQPVVNDGRGELVLHRGWWVETTDNGTSMWLLREKSDGTIQRRDVSDIFIH